MGALKELLIDADIAAEEVLHEGCEDFKQFYYLLYFEYVTFKDYRFSI